MEAHGGYLVRLERLDGAELARLARAALAEDGGNPADASLQISSIPKRKIFRFAYDAPFTYGSAGARWYQAHHALARRISLELGATAHAYVAAADFEQVVAYGAGRPVGGEALRYEDAELPEEEVDEIAFERLKAKWPLGHLAYVFGVGRGELLTLPRASSALLDLGGSGAQKLAAPAPGT